MAATFIRGEPCESGREGKPTPEKMTSTSAKPEVTKLGIEIFQVTLTSAATIPTIKNAIPFSPRSGIHPFIGLSTWENPSIPQGIPVQGEHARQASIPAKEKAVQKVHSGLVSLRVARTDTAHRVGNKVSNRARAIHGVAKVSEIATQRNNTKKNSREVRMEITRA